MFTLLMTLALLGGADVGDDRAEIVAAVTLWKDYRAEIEGVQKSIQWGWKDDKLKIATRLPMFENEWDAIFWGGDRFDSLENRLASWEKRRAEFETGDKKKHFYTVKLRQQTVDQRCVDLLNQLPGLETLEFDYCTFEVDVNFSLGKCRKLQKITFQGGIKGSTAAVWANMSDCQATKLDYTVRTPEELAGVAAMPRLEELDVRVHSDEQLKLLLPLKDRLRKLRIFGGWFGDEEDHETGEEYVLTEKSAEILKQFTKLDYLILEASQEKAFFEALQGTPIRHLEVFPGEIADDWMPIFENWDTLEQLSIPVRTPAEIPISPERVKRFISLPNKSFDYNGLGYLFGSGGLFDEEEDRPDPQQFEEISDEMSEKLLKRWLER